MGGWKSRRGSPCLASMISHAIPFLPALYCGLAAPQRHQILSTLWGLNRRFLLSGVPKLTLLSSNCFFIVQLRYYRPWETFPSLSPTCPKKDSVLSDASSGPCVHFPGCICLCLYAQGLSLKTVSSSITQHSTVFAILTSNIHWIFALGQEVCSVLFMNYHVRGSNISFQIGMGSGLPTELVRGRPQISWHQFHHALLSSRRITCSLI